MKPTSEESSGRTGIRHGFIALLFLSLAGTPLSGQLQSDTLDVLFVGNSYIYFNNLPGMVEAISAGLEGPRVRSAAHTHGGKTLRGHVEDGHLDAFWSRDLPADGDWEVVVLQEQSTLAAEYDRATGVLGSPDAFYAATRRLVATLRSRDVRPLLYMTWAKESFPHQTGPLAEAYRSIGQELRVEVAAVGEAWARVRQQRPDLGLYLTDGSHPTPAGSYLAACVLYALITGQSPVGAPHEVVGSPWSASGPVDGSETLLVSLPVEDAQLLQTVAAEIAASNGR